MIILNKYDISKEFIENLSVEDVQLLLKSVDKNYTFYSSSNAGHVFRFTIGELFNPSRYIIEVRELDIDRYIWTTVNYINEWNMSEFYNCYINIIRDKQLNQILQ